MSAFHTLRRLASGRLKVVGPFAVLAAFPAISPRPDSHVRTTPSSIVRAPLGEDASCSTPYAAPFAAGERMEYSVKFGMFRAGTGYVEVLGRDTVRGREAWHTNKPEERSAPRPLDDGSFFFFVRTQDLVVGETYEYAQYFRPDRNPVVVHVIGRERVTVPAGTFNTIVLQPVIKTKGIFSEKGEARIWLTDDSSRVMVKMTAKVSFGTLTMALTSARRAPDQVIARAN